MPALLHTSELLLFHLCKHLPAGGSLLQPLRALYQVALGEGGWSCTHATPILLRSSQLPWALEQGQAWVSVCPWVGGWGGTGQSGSSDTGNRLWTPVLA